MPRLRSLLALVLALGLLVVDAGAPTATADGTPDIGLTKSSPGEVLVGDTIDVTLTVQNPTGTPGYNLSFNDTLPAGVTYVPGSATPDPQVLVQGDGSSVLVWSNVADSLPGTSVSLSYQAVADASYDVGDTVVNTANAYVQSDPRFLPRFDPATGAALAGTFTGFDGATATTLLVPFLLTKSEPNAEGELLRGVHDHQTVYTLTVDNNFVNPSVGFSLVDFLPAGLEFLGCGTVDNTTYPTPGDEYVGSGPINPGNAPTLTNPCPTPSSVTTVTTDPDGPGPMPNDVYTRVEWDTAALAAALGSADLAPGGSFSIDYVAAIPLRENFDVPLTDPTANLDNNLGSLTVETAGEQEQRNYAVATGDYDNGTPTTYTDDDTAVVSSEDVSIHKTASTGTFDQGTDPVFTLFVESSEYAVSTGPITVTDTIPASLDYVAGTTSPAPDGPPVVQPDGSLLATWTLPPFTAPNSTATITLGTSVREFYRNGAGGDSPDPVSSRDVITNTTSLSTTATTIIDAAGTTAANVVADESSASLTSSGPSISKEVGQPVVGVMPSCGDGSAITFIPGPASVYRPGDRVCWRLRVDFPNRLDTVNPTVVDFLPAGFDFVSASLGAGNEAVVDSFSAAAAPQLVWELGDADAEPAGDGIRFEAVVETVIVDPSVAAPADLLDNLMKFTYENTAGEVFQERDEALAELSEPVVDLVKGVIEVNNVAVPGAPADGVAVEEGDVVTYGVRVDNVGSETALDVSVRDILPTGIDCSAVSAISNGGACTVNAGRDHIQWDRADGIDVSAGGSVTLTYDVTIPVGVSAGANLVNDAGVREYGGATNQATPNDEFVFVPANNIDPTLAAGENTERADDPSNVVTASPTIDKTRTTELNEGGNALSNQATIGETVSYTVTVDLPAGVTYYDAVVSDTLNAEQDLLAGTVSATLDGTPLPTAGVTLNVNDPGNSFTVDFPATYTIPSGPDQQLVVTFDAVVTDVASNVRNTTVSNRADFDFENATGTARNVNDTITTQVVEPNIVLDKAHDDADGVVEAGQTITYTVTVENDNAIPRVSTAHDTVVVDTVPPQLIVQAGTISNGGVLTPGATASDPSTITWNLATIAPGASVDLTYDVVVDTPVVAAGSLTNNANAITTSYPGTPTAPAVERASTSPNGGPGSGYQDPASATVSVPQLAIAKSAVPGTATVGETITYTLDVTVPGGVIAYDVTVIDQLPPGVVFESLTSVTCVEGGGACTPDIAAATVVPAGPYASGDDIAFFVGDLTTAGAAARVVTIVYDGYVADSAAADDGSTLTNSANAFWNATDQLTTPPTTVPAPGSFDDAATPSTADVDTVEPTLTVDKDVAGQVADTDTRRARPGDVLTYTVVVTNSGTSPAYDVTVTDVASDTAWAFVDTTAAAGVTNTDSDPVGGLEWTIDGPIAPAASVTISYTLTVPAGYDSSNETPAGPEQTNVADVPSYFGVPEATRTANPGRTFREYDDVAPDTVTIELDLASIGDRVWFDVNDDGVQDPGEPGLANVDVTVTYLGVDGLPGGGDDEVFTVSTDANGNYLVEDLPGGNYTVDVDEADPDFLPGLAPSYDQDGGTGAPNGFWSGFLGQNQDRVDVDFGYTGAGSIGDTIWFDQDGDGVKDAGEAGLGGVDVTVTWYGPDGNPGGGDDIVYTDTTDADGLYLVPNLPAGDYAVSVDGTDIPAGMSVVTDPDATPDGTSTLTLGAGANDLDQDFGYRGAGSIGDTIYLDQDGDGTQDPGEPGLQGVTVQVTSFGPDDAPGGGDDSVFTTTTDASGNYLVGFLPPGEYRVDVLGGLPANVTNTGDPDGGGDSSSLVTLTSGVPVDLDQDFGYDANSVLGDKVWWDLNGDGVQDLGEPGIPGVEITATGPNGLTLTTTTDANGDYLFTDIPDGTWTVAVTDGVPAGFGPTFDADGGTDETSTTNLTTSDLLQDFGYAGNSSIGDRLWLDLDADGVQDAGEPGVEDVTIELTWFGPDGNPGGGDDVVLTTVTDGNGNYLFPGLPAGEYTVRVDTADPDFPTGVSPTFDLDGGTASPDGVTPVTLPAATALDTVDFGYNGGGSIGDTIWLDLDGDGVLNGEEVGLGGVDVTLTYFGEDDAPGGGDDETFTTTTAADGTYLFTGLPEGNYRVDVDAADLPPGVTPTFDPDGGAPDSSLVALADGESNLDQDFGYRGAGQIGDTVYLDLNGNGTQDPGEPGVPGQAVELTWTGPSGPETFTTTTDANGNYLFDFLPDGDYTVTVVGGITSAAANTGDPDGGAPNESSLTLAGGASNLDQDFGYQGNNSIGDTVWYDVDADGTDDAGEPRLENVEVTAVWFGPDGVLGGGDDITLPVDTTDAAGTYGFAGLPDGTYSVTVTDGLPSGLDTNTFDGDDGATSPDGTSIVTDLGVGTTDPVDDLDQDFGYTGAGSIGDTIWLDQDGDGVVDPGEPGIPGAEVTVTWGGPDGVLGTADDVAYPTITTGADGTYLVENVPAGPFRVDVANLPVGLTSTADPDGGADDTTQVTLTPGETNLTQDFGYRGTASVGDTVWLDVDGDGTQDTNEPGLPGVTVTVTSAGADGTLGTADDIVVVVDTDADGTYLADGLPPGPTTITYDTGDLGAGLVPDSDLDGGDATTTTITLITGDAIRDVDFGVVGTASLSGTVWEDTDGDGVQDPDESGIAGVTVEVTWDGPNGPVTIPVVTDADGNWVLPNIPDGDYEVDVDESTVPPELVASTPPTVDVNVPPGGSGQVDNGFVPAGSIGDRVWLDANRNGVQDAGEGGAAGVTVRLLDGDGNEVAVTTTDANGNYLFDGLPPGSYTVVLDPDTLPSGTVVVSDPDGSNDGRNSVTLSPGQDITTVDFGVASPSLPSTGRTIGGVLIIAVALLGAGLALTGSTRRRRLT